MVLCLLGICEDKSVKDDEVLMDATQMGPNKALQIVRGRKVTFLGS